MKIGILECGHTIDETAKKFGTFPEMFARLLSGQDFSFASYDVENMQFPTSIQDCDGWLLTGSKHGAYEDHPFIAPLETFVRDCYETGVPLVGICFGHQLIAQALGGRVEKFRDGWAVGLTEYDFDGLGQVHLNAWHQDQVVDAPEAAKPIASNAFCENAALIYGKKALTVQAHPEFSGPIIDDYVRARKGTMDYPDDRMDRAAETTGKADSNAALAQIIGQFFKAPRNV